LHKNAEPLKRRLPDYRIFCHCGNRFVRDEFCANPPTDWLEQEMAAQRNAGAGKISQDLIWVRNMLREAAEAEQPGRRKSKKARKKKAMAKRK
jgi:hypothetical protein